MDIDELPKRQKMAINKLTKRQEMAIHELTKRQRVAINELNEQQNRTKQKSTDLDRAKKHISEINTTISSSKYSMNPQSSQERDATVARYQCQGNKEQKLFKSFPNTTFQPSNCYLFLIHNNF